MGHTIGKPEDSLIQTVDCPQVGGQMVNMVQTTISPIYGINNWLDCADICQNNLDCQYWQWSEPTSACYSVASFTGFIAADGFVTGARNCPLSTDSLVTLCPSKGSNSLMWRDTTEENGEFFNPGSTLKRGKYYSFRFRYIIYIFFVSLIFSSIIIAKAPDIISAECEDDSDCPPDVFCNHEKLCAGILSLRYIN